MEVFNSEIKGRGLKAAKEFWAGDVIFAERAYAAVVFDRYDWKVNQGIADDMELAEKSQCWLEFLSAFA